MTTHYQADMMDARSGQGGRYTFDGEDGLLKKSPVKVVRAFMEYVDTQELRKEHVDYELYSALKNKDLGVVTAMGNLILDSGEIPFLLMIAEKKDG